MRAELYDAGTVLNIITAGSQPGMDRAYFRNIDMEYRFDENIQGQVNAELRDTDRHTTLRPWPVPFPGRCWVDWTSRYEGEDGGLQIRLLRHDIAEDDYTEVPASLVQIEPTSAYDPDVDAKDGRIVDTKTMTEVQAEQPHPTKWLRLPLRNESGGDRYWACGLEQPVQLLHHGHTGDEYRLKINYSPLFAPFDGTKPEWYDAFRGDGTPLSAAQKMRAMSLRPEGHYRLYLRPANWRYVATVIAYYIYVSWFEMYEVPLIFTQSYHDRPPIYPTRHDLVHTTQQAYYPYFGQLWSYDQGISDAFNMSRAAAWLRFQIIDQQWWTLSEALIFSSCDPLTLAMWLWPPEYDDTVLGISSVDDVTGEDDVVWFVQKRDLTAEYPRTVIGSYINYEFVVY